MDSFVDFSTLPIHVLMRYQKRYLTATNAELPRFTEEQPSTGASTYSMRPLVTQQTDSLPPIKQPKTILQWDKISHTSDVSNAPPHDTITEGTLEWQKLVLECQRHYDMVGDDDAPVNEKEVLPWFVYLNRNKGRELKLDPV